MDRSTKNKTKMKHTNKHHQKKQKRKPLLGFEHGAFSPSGQDAAVSFLRSQARTTELLSIS